MEGSVCREHAAEIIPHTSSQRCDCHFSPHLSDAPCPCLPKSGHQEAVKGDEAKEGNPHHRKPMLMMVARKQNVKDTPSAALSPAEVITAALPMGPLLCAGCRGACSRAGEGKQGGKGH